MMHKSTDIEKMHAAVESVDDMKQRIAELEAQIATEKEAYHTLANEAQEKYTRCGLLERENAKLRKLCGEAVFWIMNTDCEKLECRRCEHISTCGLAEGSMARKLRAAAGGGE